ncbi:enoyl-CoA hydratase-related protein [Janibacter limosus]|uniref:Enoyl-CoA hydratase-related protein n=1 Tax=Janibacter limosus TaxID=53458 RepID=A0AC61U6L3_9MICO|nr:enoyl-CoA hydratase-related protein [Janibacter limosus]UUZ45684.1 enoyl-CoA hydratase-related protein [Janibacter limosus]
MATPLVTVETTDTVTTITIEQPQTRNALSLPVMEAVIDALEEVARRTDVHAVVLATAGHVFSSGHNLAEVRAADRQEQQRIFSVCSRMMLLVQQIPQPVIARVRGRRHRRRVPARGVV